MRKQDYVISVLLHVGLLALIVILSAVASGANEFNPDDIARVQLIDNIPAGAPQQAPEPVVEEPPEFEMPELPDDQAIEQTVEEEPVQLASIETPAEIAVKEIKEKKPKPEKPKEKPKPKPSTTSDASAKQTKTTTVSEGEVSTSIEAGQGGLGVGNFPYDIARVTQMIDLNWSNPVLSQKNLSCVVYFQIDRQGIIKGAVVEESSGNDDFDRNALMAVMRTKEVPPLPISYDYDVLGFHLEFEYTP